MKYYRELSQIQIPEETAVTIGKFDGLHIGHQRLLNQIVNEEAAGRKSCVVRLLIPDNYKKPHAYLTSEKETRKMLEKAGVDYYVALTLDEELRSMSADDFLNKVLLEKLNMGILFCGEDFAFGKNAAGNIDYLQKMSEEKGFSLRVFQKESAGSVEAGATKIREFLIDGEVEQANALLGYSYHIDGTVVHGNHLGTGFGFPTANIYPDHDKMFPRFGVYACKVRIGHRVLKALVNVGVKPTIDGAYSPLIEANLFDFSEDIYGINITVSFLKFIRPEMKFSSVDELKEQMEKDRETCVSFFTENE